MGMEQKKNKTTNSVWYCKCTTAGTLTTTKSYFSCKMCHGWLSRFNDLTWNDYNIMLVGVYNKYYKWTSYWQLNLWWMFHSPELVFRYLFQQDNSTLNHTNRGCYITSFRSCHTHRYLAVRWCLVLSVSIGQSIFPALSNDNYAKSRRLNLSK